MAKRLIIAISAVLCLAIGSVLAVAWGWQQLNAPLNLPESGLLVTVDRGAALATVTADLETRGVLKYPRLLDWYAQLIDAETRIQAGEYQLASGLTGVGLIEKLARGEVYLHQFTIIEGLRFEDMLKSLRAHPAVVATDLTGLQIIAEIARPEHHPENPEGQFLPDTYSFPRGTTDIELLRWAHNDLWSLLEESWSSRRDTDVLTEPYQGLILASIIEKETALDRERGLISGVFHERLRRKIPLQTDPTVIYGVGSDFNGDLTRAQLDADTPYNTYTRRGLPPTPIALPGTASIRAAFAPDETDALYFVATGDPDGSHAFSRTLEEHNAAVRRYRQRQRDGL